MMPPSSTTFRPVTPPPTDLASSTIARSHPGSGSLTFAERRTTSPAESLSPRFFLVPEEAPLLTASSSKPRGPRTSPAACALPRSTTATLRMFFVSGLSARERVSSLAATLFSQSWTMIVGSSVIGILALGGGAPRFIFPAADPVLERADPPVQVLLLHHFQALGCILDLLRDPGKRPVGRGVGPVKLLDHRVHVPVDRLPHDPLHEALERPGRASRRGDLTGSRASSQRRQALVEREHAVGDVLPGARHKVVDLLGLPDLETAGRDLALPEPGDHARHVLEHILYVSVNRFHDSPPRSRVNQYLARYVQKSDIVYPAVHFESGVPVEPVVDGLPLARQERH